MSTLTMQLSGADLELLQLVQADKVGFSRGRYFLTTTGQRDVHDEVMRLRGLKLVVLQRTPPGGRFPPTQRCELTAAGKAALQQRP